MKRVLSLLAVLLFAVNFTASAQDEPTEFVITDGIIGNELRLNMQNNLKTIFQAFQQTVVSTTPLTLPKKGLTKDAVNDIKMLWETSKFICPVMMVEQNLINTTNGYEVRNIPVYMLDAERDAEQELVVSFDKAGNISAIDISIGLKVYSNIMAEANGDVVDMENRQHITNFIEVFRTAYNKKDIKYLEQVYSDDALIITGRIVKAKVQSPEQQRQLYGERIEYIKRTKKEYIDNLRAAFNKAKYINVKFSDLVIRRHPKYPDVYGVRLRQDWTANTYHDDGFVFLMIDFRNKEKPEIHVRTWQPAMKDGKLLSDDEIFGLNSFQIGA